MAAFECDKCKPVRTFKDKANFKRHMKAHAKTAVVVCKWCDTVFASKDARNRHEERERSAGRGHIGKP